MSPKSSKSKQPTTFKHSKYADPKDPPFETRSSVIQGRGVFATRRIRKGQKLVQYVGESLSPEEADRRYDDSEGRHHTFLFVLDDHTVLDARSGGNDARFINHSCEPNCETEIGDDQIFVRAITTIAPDTELVYDYRFEWDDAYDADDVRYYACRCGSAKCRGTILRVPAYLKKTVREWLAGNDVPKPRKPRKKKKSAGKKAEKKAAKKADKKKAVKKEKKKAKKAKKAKKGKKRS